MASLDEQRTKRDVRAEWRDFALVGALVVGVGLVVGIAVDRAWGVDWDAVAAVSTSIAVVVYLGGLWITSRQTWDHLRQDREMLVEELKHNQTQFEEAIALREAEEIRASVRDFASTTASVCRQIADGAAINSMCWLTAELALDVAKRRPVEDEATTRRQSMFVRNSLRRLLKDGHAFLSVWLRAAETSPSMSALTRDADELRALAAKLRGELALAGELAALLQDMVDDIRIVIHDERIRQSIADAVPDGAHEPDLVSFLSESLNGNLSYYVYERYAAATHTLTEIAEALATTSYELSHRALVDAGGSSSQVPEPAVSSRIGTIGYLAEQFFARSGSKRSTEVSRLVGNLAEQIAKPAAVAGDPDR